MTQCLEAFLEALFVEKGASPNTIESYRRDLKHFAQFLKITPLEKGTTDNVRAYLKYLNDHHLAVTTRMRRLSALRQFYRYLLEQKIISLDPCFEVDMPTKGRSLPKILNEDEITNLLKATFQQEGAEGIRVRCLLELLYATGLRVSELVSLPLSNMIYALKSEQIPAVLIVKGKGNKERVVLLSQAACHAVQAYLPYRARFETVHAKDKWLFPSSSKAGYLTRQRFGQILKEVSRLAGIEPRKVSPHVIRHAFATHLLAHGADLLSLQTLLGHSDISTTEIYTHVENERLKKLVFTHHPLAAK